MYHPAGNTQAETPVKPCAPKSVLRAVYLLEDGSV